MFETTNQQKNNQNQNLTVSCLKCGPNSSRVDCLWMSLHVSACLCMSLLCKYRRGWHSTFRLLKPTFPMRNKTKVEQVCQKIIRISSLKCTIWSSNHRYNLGHHPSCKGVYIYIYVWPALELWNHPTNHLPAYNCCSCHKVLLAIPNVLGWFHHHCSLMWVPKDPHNCWFPEFGIKPYNFSESQKKIAHGVCSGL